MKVAQTFTKNNIRMILAFIVLIVVSGSVYGIWQVPLLGIGATATPTPYQTASVSRGDIAITASGNGNLNAGKKVDLNFSEPGTIADIKFQVGDRVKIGDILAALKGLDALKIDVDNKTLALQVAQKALDDLISGKDKNLAQALADRAAAQKALHSAEYNLHFKGQGRCDPSLTNSFQFDYQYAEYKIKGWEKIQLKRNLYGNMFINSQIQGLQKVSNQNFLSWKWCEVYSDQEILDSKANLQVAQANNALAEQTYQKFLGASGIDPMTKQIDEAAVENAKAQLTVSQKNLEGATIVTPMDGVVIAVSGNIGDTLNFSRTGSSSSSVSPASSLSTSTSITASLGQTSTIKPFITISDLDHPQLLVYMDETDAPNFNVGCPAAIVFASIPGQTFTGVVTTKTPALVSVRNVNMVQGTVGLTNNPPVKGKTLPIGESVSVDVTCHQSSNTLLVPVEAVHTVSGGLPYVFVLNQNGKPEKREVEIGLESTTFDEIRSGLSEGELVITSPVNS